MPTLFLRLLAAVRAVVCSVVCAGGLAITLTACGGGSSSASSSTGSSSNSGGGGSVTVQGVSTPSTVSVVTATN